MPDYSDYISGELFHLVGFRDPDDHEKNYETLKEILTGGWLSHPPHEKNWGETKMEINWDADLASGEFLIPTITCFGDIPLHCLGLHAQKYGQFGLSIKRSVLVKYGARPVMYIPFTPNADEGSAISGRTLLRHLQKCFKAFDFLVAKKVTVKDIYVGAEPTTPEAAIEATWRIFGKEFLAFIKPFDSTLPSDHPQNYYMEREWRKFGNLKLRPDDISTIVSTIVVHADFLQKAKTDLPEYRNIIHALPPPF
jgi:Putative abortive phage resistance protein AbiGi, antitoxin